MASNSKELDRQQAKWVQVLSQFNIDIVYRPGRINPADALSRHPMHRLAAISMVQTSPELLAMFEAAYQVDPLYRSATPSKKSRALAPYKPAVVQYSPAAVCTTAPPPDPVFDEIGSQDDIH